MRKRSRSPAAAPADWQTKPLGAVANRVTDRNAGRNQNVLTISAQAGLISQKEYFSRRVASEEVHGYFLLRRGDFAYNKSYSAGFPVGVIRRLERYAEGVVSPLYICFRSSRSDVDSDFLKHYFAAGLVDDDIAWVAKEGVRNHGLLNVGVGDFFSVDLHLPPATEQRRIAGILDTLDEAIRKNEQIVDKMKWMKQGLLHDLLTRGIDNNGELRDPERHPEQFNDSPLGQLPRHWKIGPAARWCARLTVGVVNSATHAYSANGVPFIRSQNVKANCIDRSDMLFVTEGFNRQQSKSILRAGDVVIVRTGYPGTAAVVPPSLDGSNCFSLIIASPVIDLNSSFLAQYLNSPTCMAEISRTHFGSAQHNFNVGEMRRLPLSIPPLEEQQAILQVLSEHEERSSAEEAQVLKLRLLKRGLTEDLLTGRVRVTSLPTEAAS